MNKGNSRMRHSTLEVVSRWELILGRPVEEDGEMVVQVAMEMSLDEWKALQEMSRPKAEFNIRKAENKIPSKAKVIHQSRHPEVSRMC